MLIMEYLTSNVKMTEDQRWKEFGVWLQRMRKVAKISQETLAKRAGITEVHLSRIENGHSGVKRETVLRLIDGLKVNGLASPIEFDRALKKAGFADPSSEEESFLERLEQELRVKRKTHPELTEEDLEEFREEVIFQFDAFARRIQARREREKHKQEDANT